MAVEAAPFPSRPTDWDSRLYSAVSMSYLSHSVPQTVAQYTLGSTQLCQIYSAVMYFREFAAASVAESANGRSCTRQRTQL